MSASRLVIEDCAVVLEAGKLADTASGARESSTASQRLVERSEELTADGHNMEVAS